MVLPCSTLRRRRRPTTLLLPAGLLILSPLISATLMESKAAQFSTDRIPEVRTGTTILAAKYRDGVVVGADTRTSVSGYVSNRYASKVAFVLDRGLVGDKSKVLGDVKGEEAEKEEEDDEPCRDLSTCAVLRSGSSADTQSLADDCRHHLLRRSILHGQHSGVSDAARLLRTLIYNEPDVSASLICAGWDHTRPQNNGENKERGEGVIYTISPGGSIVEEKDGWAIGGSGSSYLMAHVDSRYSHGQCQGWTEEEAVEFVAESIGLATERDGSSGGLVRLWIINKRGRRSVVMVPGHAAEAGEQPGARVAALDGFALPSPV